MRVQICAVGRMRASPERTLVNDYLTRFDKSGRPLALGPATLTEVEDRKGGGMMAEAALLERAIVQGALVCVLDERGKAVASPEFAAALADWRDHGHRDIAFVIGGAGGLAPDLRNRADFALSFGTMVWPHMLIRVMLAEQLYRAASILAGAPYHRA